MPDGDYLAWRAGGRWGRVETLLRQGRSSPEVEDAIAKALADTLRRSGGVSWFDATVDLLVELGASDGAAVVARPASQARTVVSQIFERVANALALQLQQRMAFVSPDQAARVLARNFLSQLSLGGLEQTLPSLVGGESLGPRDLREVHLRWTDSLFEKLLDRFLADPTSSRLRAPTKPTTPRSLKDILATSVDRL